MFPLPHIRKPTPVQRDTRSVIANRDLQGSRKECVAATHPVQQPKTFLSDLRRKIRLFQRLVVRTFDADSNQSDFGKEGERRTYLIYYVDEGLGVAPAETTDDVALVLTREDRLN